MRVRTLAVAVTTVAGLLAATLVALEDGTANAAPVPLREAPDARSAASLARAQGSRVEVLAERTETRTVYADPGGTMAAEVSMLPIRVRRGAGWAAPDTTVVPRPDGSVGPAAPAVDLSFSGGGSGALVRLARGGKWFELRWPGRLPTPSLSGSKATYAEVMPGVDLVMQAGLSGYAQYLVINNPAAAAHPAVADVKLGLRTGGLTMTGSDSGALEARDSAGAVVFQAPVSRMWDAAGRQAVVKVAVGNGALTLRPDPTLLRDPAAKFPITVDPIFDTAGFAAWTSVLSGNPNTAYPNSSGESGRAQVGFCRTTWSDCKGINLAWSYFQFNTDWLAHGPTVRRVLDARLALTVAHSADCSGTGTPHRLFKAQAAIHPGTTWNNRPGGDHITDFHPPKANPDWGCPGFKEVGLNVTSRVNLGGTTTFLVTAANENDDEAGKLFWRKYDAYATKLFVTWNDRPFLPYELTTDPPIKPPCTHCGGMRFVADENIRLRVKLSDPNGEGVAPVWRIFTDGEMDELKSTDYKQPGQEHSTTINLRHGTGVEWYVKAFDSADHSWDPSHLDGWTHANGSSPFAVDREPPGTQPGVTSPSYIGGRWHGGAGIPGTFIFNSAGVWDIDHFLYSFDGAPVHKVDADKLGGKAVVELTPTQDGPHGLTVWSVDRAGNQSRDSTTYHFHVRAGRGPLAQWSLEGSTNDEAFLGDRHGTLNGNAKFGPGAVGSGLRLDGQHYGTNMSAPSPIRTDASFSVSAWVKPEPLRSGQVMGAVSQDGEFNSGFYLSYRGDTNKWAFLMLHDGGSASSPGTFATAPEPPQIGRWTHLTGVYDRPANKIRLYVNGVLRSEQPLPANFTPWDAPHALYVGRQKCGVDKCDPWSGGIDEVKVYDRVLPDTEIRELVGTDNVQVDHWRLDELGGSGARSEVQVGQTLTLRNGASFTGDSDEDGIADGGAIDGALQLDGTDDEASTPGPAVRTDQSFSVSAWARLDHAPPVGQTFPVLAQDGTQVSGLFLWYRTLANGGAWEFYLPSADSSSRQTADEMIVFQVPATPAPEKWTHLAAVYDAPNKRLRLYVDGAAAAERPRNFGFDATGPLRIGRGTWNGNPTNAWPGGVDEVRGYSRALSAAEVQSIVSKDNVPAAEWKLDGNVNGKTPAQNGTVHDGVIWGAGRTAMPDPNDRAAQFGASGAHLSAPNVVDVRQSFSVSAWIKPDRFGSWWVPLSQDGNTVSAFKVQLTDRGHWTFVMFGADETNGGTGGARATGTLAQAGVWQHVVGVYDAGRRQIAIYVNGVLADTAPHNQVWNYAAGRFVIGADKWNTARGGSFPGSVDDVVVHSRVLFADEIRAMAGRDLSLVHNWTLDETSGTTVADSIGRRTGSLSGGAGRVAGRVGNGITLDGVDDQVAIPGVDLRTDDNFSVSAWVHLAQTCDRGTAFSCSLAAVSLDGSTNATTDSKFRLGHLKDANHPEGVWMFEMPEPDGTRRAAVTIRPSDLNTWVHLAGVYDRVTGKLVLYVNGTRKGEALLQNPWHATGSLLIGRGRDAAGQPAQFFRGQVDDVRLYSARLDNERVSDLYNAYPKPS